MILRNRLFRHAMERTTGFQVFYRSNGLQQHPEHCRDREIGFYQDPYSDFGRLAMELFRAARLVVDTGIHRKKWSREKALKYFKDNTPDPEGDNLKEIERYIVWPSQATGYKIGMNKILELRENTKKKLGSKFDIREFHDVVITSGPLPMDILEEVVNAWVAKKIN